MEAIRQRVVCGRTEVPSEQERRRARDAPEAGDDVRKISRNGSFALTGVESFDWVTGL